MRCKDVLSSRYSLISMRLIIYREAISPLNGLNKQIITSLRFIGFFLDHIYLMDTGACDFRVSEIDLYLQMISLFDAETNSLQ